MNGIYLDAMAVRIHAGNVKAGWWTNIRTGETLLGFDDNGVARRNFGELLMLVVSELAEGAEGAEGGLMDDKLPHRRMFEVELGDFIIRVLDIAGSRDFQIGADYDDATRTEFGAGYEACRTVNDYLMRMVRYVSTAMEADRKSRPGVSSALAHALGGAYLLEARFGMNLEDAIEEKLAFNAERADHKVENRLGDGGKAY